MNKEDFFDHLVVCRDFDNAIIKGHLLTEHLLNHFIESHSKDQINIQELRFTYSNKIEIAKILGLYINNRTLYEKLKLLNKLRNSIAHKLHHDERVLADFLVGVDELIIELKSDPNLGLSMDKMISVNSGDGVYKITGHQIIFCMQVAYLCGMIDASNPTPWSKFITST